MENFTLRKDVDEEIAVELSKAGIKVGKFPETLRDSHPEMRTIIHGQLGPWSFSRAWYYWIASGPGIPPVYANELHEKFGCSSPKEWFKGFAVGFYHVDTQEGLNALADTIRKVMKDNE